MFVLPQTLYGILKYNLVNVDIACRAEMLNRIIQVNFRTESMLGTCSELVTWFWPEAQSRYLIISLLCLKCFYQKAQKIQHRKVS